MGISSSRKANPQTSYVRTYNIVCKSNARFIHGLNKLSSLAGIYRAGHQVGASSLGKKNKGRILRGVVEAYSPPRANKPNRSAEKWRPTTHTVKKKIRERNKTTASRKYINRRLQNSPCAEESHRNSKTRRFTVVKNNQHNTTQHAPHRKHTTQTSEGGGAALS